MNSKRAYKLCPDCRFFCHIDEPDEYCLRCGSKLIKACPGCQAPIDLPHARFCKHCGHLLSKHEQNQSDDSHTTFDTSASPEITPSGSSPLKF